MHRMMAVLACTLLAAACGGDDTETADSTTTNAAASTTATPSTTAAASTTATPSTIAAATSEWVIQDAPGCVCADGSDYQFMTRPGDPEKVVLFLQGGGACFTAETCEVGGAQQSYSHDIVQDVAAAEAGGIQQGLFDSTNPENPVADWTIIYLPYCTGDVFLGTRQHTYNDDVVINHTGALNAMKGTEFLFENHPTVSQVLVTGSSAGGVPSPLIGGVVAEQYPGADIMALGDGAGGYGANPAVMGFLDSQWGIGDGIPEWPVTDEVDVTTLGAPDNYILAAEQWDNLRVARFDHAYDETQTSFASLFSLSGGGSVLDVLLESEAYIEDAGVDLPVYIAAGNNHTVHLQEEFYVLETEGVRWVDWLASFVDGEPLADVKCTDCGSPPG